MNDLTVTPNYDKTLKAIVSLVEDSLYMKETSLLGEDHTSKVGLEVSELLKVLDTSVTTYKEKMTEIENFDNVGVDHKEADEHSEIRSKVIKAELLGTDALLNLSVILKDMLTIKLPTFLEIVTHEQLKPSDETEDVNLSSSALTLEALDLNKVFYIQVVHVSFGSLGIAVANYDLDSQDKVGSIYKLMDKVYTLTNSITNSWWDNDSITPIFSSKGCRSTSVGDVLVLLDIHNLPIAQVEVAGEGFNITKLEDSITKERKLRQAILKSDEEYNIRKVPNE